MARLTVIGLGKVGFPLACYLASLGHSVIGYDHGREVVTHLKHSKDPMPWEPHTRPDDLKLITSNINEAVDGSEAFFITVPTPADRRGYLSSEIVERVIKNLVRMAPTKLRIVVSTLDPRTAAQVCSGRLTVYSPPLVRLGSVMEDLRQPPLRMVGGTDHEAMGRAGSLLAEGDTISSSMIYSNPTTIALAKLAINVTLSAKVAWANEIAELAQTLGANADVVTQIISSDPRIGSAFMQPGWPPSGPCLPRDLVAWCSLYRRVELSHSLAFTVRANHSRTKEMCLGDLISQITDSKPKKVGVIGLNYRPGVPSSEGTLGQELITLGRARGWSIEGQDLGEGTQALVDSCDVIVITTPQVPEQLDFKGKHVIAVGSKE